MQPSFDIGLVLKHVPFLMKGLEWTAWMTGWSLLLGVSVGLLICLANLSGIKALVYLSRAYIQLFRNVPRLVLLIWVYYCTGSFFHVNLSPLVAAITTFGLLTGAYMAEIFRAGILSVSKGEVRAGRALGMGYFLVLRKIVFPQAIRVSIPALTNQFVITIKTTTIAMIIGVPELTHRARTLSTVTFRPMEFYTAIALLYFVVCLAVSQAGAFLERRVVRYR